MHDGPLDVLVDAYPEEEYWQDLLKVTGGITNEPLARLAIRASSTCRDWMRSHGVNFQPPLSGTLHVARTNAFFMGGGKALVNAYFRSAEKLGSRYRAAQRTPLPPATNYARVAWQAGVEKPPARGRRAARNASKPG